MGPLEYIIGGVLIVFALLIIFVVLMQEGRQANVGVISGAADTFLDKGAAKTWDMRLAKWTKIIAITFFVLVLAGMLVTNLLSKMQKNDAAQGITTTFNTTTTAHVHGDDCNHETTAAGSTTTTAAGSTTTTAGSTTTTTAAAE